MRFAIICSGGSLEPWQARCVERLLAGEGAEPVALIAAEGTGARRSFWRGLFGLYVRRLRRRQLGQSVANYTPGPDLARVGVRLRDAPGGAQAVWDEDLAVVSELGLDFILSLGIDRLAGPLLEIPRYGVWAFDFDRDPTERLGLGQVTRLLTGHSVSGAALLRLTSAPDRAVVLREGHFRTEARTLAEGIARIRDESAKWPSLVCGALKRGEPSRVEGPVVDVRSPGYPVPGSFRMVLIAAMLVRNRLRLAWRRLFRHPQWNIGLIDQPIHKLLGGVREPVRWFPLAGKRGFLADPFGLERNGEATILCEYFKYRDGKGTICSIDASGGDFASTPQSVLALPGHLSYPCLIEDDGSVYCVPEMLGTRGVTLFRADPFPRRWRRVDALVENVSAVDPTVFRHGDRWWLMCVDGEGAPDVNLLVWHAPALEGPWTSHAANPVKTDIRSARPAGTPFEHRGRLYRPAQDCSRSYGGRIVINEISRLTPEEFAEEPATVIEPTPDGPYPAGRHTLSALGDRTLIDGHRFVFVGTSLLNFVRIWKRDLLGTAKRRAASGEPNG